MSSSFLPIASCLENELVQPFLVNVGETFDQNSERIDWWADWRVGSGWETLGDRKGKGGLWIGLEAWWAVQRAGAVLSATSYYGQQARCHWLTGPCRIFPGPCACMPLRRVASTKTGVACSLVFLPELSPPRPDQLSFDSGTVWCAEYGAIRARSSHKRMSPIHSCGGYGAFFLLSPRASLLTKHCLRPRVPVSSLTLSLCQVRMRHTVEPRSKAKHMNDLTNHQSQPVTVYYMYYT